MAWGIHQRLVRGGALPLLQAVGGRVPDGGTIGEVWKGLLIGAAQGCVLFAQLSS